MKDADGDPILMLNIFAHHIKVTALRLLRLIRGHGQVENCLHWMKDSGWNEDGHYLKHGQEMFVETTNTALLLLRLMQKPDESVQERTEEVHFNPKKFLYLLGIA